MTIKGGDQKSAGNCLPQIGAQYMLGVFLPCHLHGPSFLLRVLWVECEDLYASGVYYGVSKALCL